MKKKINPRSKGKRFEYIVRDLVRGFGFEASRTPMSGAIEGWKGDITSKDLPLFLECKNCETSHFLEWFHKAEEQCQSKAPVIVYTKNHEQIYAFLLFSDLMQFIVKHNQELSSKAKTEESQDLEFSKKKQLNKNYD